MKKRIAAILIFGLSLMLGGTIAFAEENADPAGAKIECVIENGSYIISISDENGDLGWLADDMSQDGSVVKLAKAELEGDTFVIQYDPVADGEIMLNVRHFTGIACDQVHSFDLVVENGKITENKGGSYTASPDPSELDPYLSGKWVQEETELLDLEVTLNESGRGWDVVAVSSEEGKEFLFKTTVYYDCELDSFVYDKGKFWDTPADMENLGEATQAGTSGSFTFVEEEQGLCLSWLDGERFSQDGYLFARAAGKQTDTAYLDQDGNEISVTAGDDGVICR